LLLRAVGAQASEILAAASDTVWLLDKAASEGLVSQPLSSAEKALLNYSALGQLLIDSGGALMSSLPFGPTVAALMGAVYSKAVQVWDTTEHDQLYSMHACLRV
jgi:hypothetical protein